MGRKDKKSHDPRGSVLRDARTYRGISLSDMADRTGYTKSHLSSVEMGITNPSLDLVEAYESILNMRLKPVMKLGLRRFT